MKNIILITGASGFIGSHLVEELLRDGVALKNLRLLIQPGASLENLPQRKFNIVWGDVRDNNFVEKAVDGVETVYHLAAETISWRKRYEDYRVVNVDGTQNLLNSLKGKKIQKFIFFSSIAVFGLPAYSGERINCDETWPKKPSEDYGRSKLEAEKRVIKAYKEWEIPYVIIRPTTVYGPRDHQNIMELYEAIKNHYFIRIGDGSNKMDYVYVEDLVKGARQAQLDKSKANDFILGAGKPITTNEVINSVAKSINEEVPNWHLPKNVMLPLSYAFDLLGHILNITAPLFPSRVKVLTTSCYFNSAKAQKQIGYNPQTPFATGTMITGRWLLKNKKI